MKKSAIISNDPQRPPIYLNGEAMQYEKESRYLGTKLSEDNTNTAHINMRIKKAKAAAGMLRGTTQ